MTVIKKIVKILIIGILCTFILFEIYGYYSTIRCAAVFNPNSKYHTSVKSFGIRFPLSLRIYRYLTDRVDEAFKKIKYKECSYYLDSENLDRRINYPVTCRSSSMGLIFNYSPEPNDLKNNCKLRGLPIVNIESNLNADIIYEYMESICLGDYNTFNKLVSHIGTKVQIEEKTPLIIAIRRHQVEMVRKLLDLGADVNKVSYYSRPDIVEHEGDLQYASAVNVILSTKPLYEAKKQSNDEIINLLREKGAM